MPVVTGTFLVGPVSDSLTQRCPPPPALFNTEPASRQTRLKEPGMLGPPRGWASLLPGGAPAVAVAAGTELLPVPVSPPLLSQPVRSSGPHPLNSMPESTPGRKHIPGRYSRESPPVRESTHRPCAYVSCQLSTLSVTTTLLGASSTTKGRPTQLRLSGRPEPFIRVSDIHWSVPGHSDRKESACNAGDLGLPGREWQPTPGFLPGEFHGQRSLAGHSPGGLKESRLSD